MKIQPRGEDRSASLVPTIDLDAAEARIEELERALEELENDLEDAGIALLLQERLAATHGDRLTAAEFLEGIGMEEFVGELPKR